MSTETVTQAVEKRDNGPASLIQRYTGDFASVLPSHVKAETWVRLAQGALRKGKRINAPNPKDANHANHGRFELEVAAGNNPGVFLASLLDAARLGLEPGTEQYYLTPRKVTGRLEILGIVGYQGHIELMYRAGAVAAVVAEVVRDNDGFVWTPGRLDTQIPPRWQGPMVQPLHEVDWFGGERGKLKGVYAYATMKDGAVSKVIVLSRTEIDEIKKKATGATSEYSPWVQHEPAMWLKSAVRQLQKWVPTSAEYRREILRATVEAQRVAEPSTPFPSTVDDGDVFDGELVDEPDWPEVAGSGS